MDSDNNIEFNPVAEYWQLDIIEALLKTASISAENNEYWSKRLNTLSYTEADNLINYLQERQINKVLAGLNYNATYLNKFLKDTI